MKARVHGVAALMVALSIGLVAWLPSQTTARPALGRQTLTPGPSPTAEDPQAGRETVTPSLTPSPTRPIAALPLVVRQVPTRGPTAIVPTPTRNPLVCAPEYPTVCIPPPPPPLNCRDIPHRYFVVLPPDRHGFDGNDRDGIGCEMP